ncbi:MAG: Double-GTPase 2 [Planctomycetota bacterium]|jgi:hypothetical protein
MDNQQASDSLAPIARDTILVLGGPGAGKTVWIARLLDALRTPTTLFNGRISDGEGWSSGSGSSTLHCEFADAVTKRRNESTNDALAARQWPPSTQDPVEHVVDFVITGEGIKTPRRRITLVDLPGSALLAAFAPSNPSTLTIGWTVGNQLARTAAVVLLIDPTKAVERTRESIDLTNATVAMLEHLRASPEGRSIPLAIILSKGDRGYKTIMKEGGVRLFAERHLRAILDAAGAARLYIASATRSRLVAPGYREPSTRRPVENLIEPMYFLLGTIDRIDAIRRRAAMVMQADARRRGAGETAGFAAAERSNARARKLEIPAYAWVIFSAGMLLFVLVSARAAMRTGTSGTPTANPATAPASSNQTEPKERTP